MSERPIFHAARLVPLTWKVDCPVCETEVEIEVCAKDDGSFQGDGADQFPQCPECDSLIEVMPVQVLDFLL